MDKKQFKMHANCMIVKGFSKSTICDLYKGRYREIPNELADVLRESRTISLNEIGDLFENKEDIDGFILFLDFFVQNDWAFYTNTPALFPELDTKWESPSKITNAVVDINDESDFDLKKCIHDINELGCTGIQFRLYSKTNPDIFKLIAEETQFLEFEYIEIISKFNDALDISYYVNYLKNNNRISKLVITGATENKKLEGDGLVYVKEEIDFVNDCGVINSDYFAVNIEHFTESVNFNNCLNKKISIDTNGEIRNCPSMKQSFGNVKQKTLQSVISNDEFISVWKLKKDDIEICKACEYRYICSDCRAFTENGDLKSKPSKCKYDPYKGVWND